MLDLTGIEIQMLLSFSVGLVVGLQLGSGHVHDKIVEQLQKADSEGKSLKDALKEITPDDEDQEMEVADESD